MFFIDLVWNQSVRYCHENRFSLSDVFPNFVSLVLFSFVSVLSAFPSSTTRQRLQVVRHPPSLLTSLACLIELSSPLYFILRPRSLDLYCHISSALLGFAVCQALKEKPPLEAPFVVVESSRPLEPCESFSHSVV
jgi:hypothetical protein